jgi:ubiquinone/menaquinone biosynthesis C-methylase UbiE
MVSIERTRDVWKRAAEFPPNKEFVYPEHAKVQEFATNSQKRVLEYGCGGGADTLSYLRRMCRVWYVDVVPENIARTTERVITAGKQGQANGLVLVDSAPIPLGGDYFDIVNCHGVLHHIADPVMVKHVLAEFHRLLNPRGALYLMLYTEIMYAHFQPSITSLLAQKRCATREEAFGWCADGEGVPYARAYTEDEAHTLLRDAGFRVLSASLYNQKFFRTFKAAREA